MKKIITINLLTIFLILPMCSAAHYIVGFVENALDGTGANDHHILLWNPSVGIQDNLTDIIGINGNSHASNVYMIDCEMLQGGCGINDILTLKVIDIGDSYLSEEKNVTVTGAGYDVVGNITLNSPPNITYVNVDDDLLSPQDEIDLIPADIKEVNCIARAMKYTGENSIINATGVFFDNILSGYNHSLDNNENYRNDSCVINYSYGNTNEVEIYCTFYVWYYANSQDWNCTVNITDNLSASSKRGDLSFVNPLLALGLDSLVTFNLMNPEITDESTIDVTNYGNVKINLSLSGYAFEENDGYAMNCSEGEIRNISIENEKYNLTDSNVGDITLAEFESKYKNLTSYPVVNEFNLDYRKDDITNNALNSTYWRIYVPTGISGNCQGNIVFGAAQAPGD
ncbi:MAG: hypothetical protein ACP5NZ_04125 [Nanobdellota archaeon]